MRFVAAALQAPAAPSAQADITTHKPPLGVVRADKSIGLPPKARANPPRGTTYRVYTKVLDGLPHDSRNMSLATKDTRAFYARMIDAQNRTWVAYHMLCDETSEWRLFWFFRPAHLVTTRD